MSGHGDLVPMNIVCPLLLGLFVYLLEEGFEFIIMLVLDIQYRFNLSPLEALGEDGD